MCGRARRSRSEGEILVSSAGARLLFAGLLLCACESQTTTGVRLAIRYDAPPERLRVFAHASDGSAYGPELLPDPPRPLAIGGESVLLQLPPALDQRALLLEVEGLDSNAAVMALGSQVAQVVSGAIVDSEVLLIPAPSCPADRALIAGGGCAPGEIPAVAAQAPTVTVEPSQFHPVAPAASLSPSGALVPDAGVPDVVPDASAPDAGNSCSCQEDCPKTACAHCGDGCCNKTCPLTGCSQSCSDCSCSVGCKDTTGNCAVDCSADSHCEVNCDHARACSLTCASSVCDLDCRHAKSCQVSCTGESDCHVKCEGAENCSMVRCDGSASCLLECDTAKMCGFASCPAGAMSCPKHIFVCNRACPMEGTP